MNKKVLPQNPPLQKNFNFASCKAILRANFGGQGDLSPCGGVGGETPKVFSLVVKLFALYKAVALRIAAVVRAGGGAAYGDVCEFAVVGLVVVTASSYCAVYHGFWLLS